MKAILLVFILSTSTFAVAKDYQVTGLISEITDSKIVIDKKGEKFEIAKVAATKTSGGDLKAGQKATVYYTMTATEIEAKVEKKAEKKK